jgi:ferredoxin-NADP reductase/MOSC domain-containing protein YiiM
MARLLALCVGLPQDVAWQGSTVRTAVWKQAVTGPRMARRLNIDGDGQADLAGHGGEQRAVLVYQLDSYEYWQRELGRDDFVWGQFGENFTIDGLADGEVCVGDRYRIGDAVFEVTQPRVTCYRVGVRMAEPTMAALMVSHHRPGFYMRVVTEGAVQAGDEIAQIATGPESMTIAQIDALLYLPGHPRRELARALRIPALSPGWQDSFRTMLDQHDGGTQRGNVGLNHASSSPPPAWNGFRTLVLSRLEAETPAISSFWFASPDGTGLPEARPGQFVTLRVRPDDTGPALFRSYSLSAEPGAAEYRITVKREPDGAGSAFLFDHLHVGDTLDVAAPRGTFILGKGDSPVVFLSAGIGVTPVLAMLHVLAAQRSTRNVWWLHGARNSEERAFAEETAALLASLPNARAHVWYSKPAPEDASDPDASTGHLSGDALDRFGVPRAADAYLCGPTQFLADMSAALVGLGVDPAKIHTEIFGTVAASTPGVRDGASGPPRPPDGPTGNGPLVSFARSGLAVNWDDDYAHLLELAEACHVPTRWSCRSGVCHTCETAIVSGKVTYDPQPVDAPADGNILICCARPQTELVLDL